MLALLPLTAVLVGVGELPRNLLRDAHLFGRLAIVRGGFHRAVLGLDGAIGDNWSWNAYYQHSESHLYEVYHSIEIKQNFLNATDAVTVTAANQGKSNIAIGSIACRSTLTDPGNGCIPYNIMGTGVADPLSVRYIIDNHDYYHLNVQQDSAGASMQGVLPWDLIGAGAPSTAFGVEYRKEAAVSTADPNGAIGALGGGNFIGIRGQYNVIEGFVELDVPLIKNGIVNSLDANLAGRMTSYKPVAKRPFEEVKADVQKAVLQQEEQALAVKAGQERLAQLQAKDDATGFSDAKVVSRVKSDGWTQEAFNAVMKADTVKLPAYVGAETQGLGYQIYRVTKVEQPKTVDTARRKAEQEQIVAALSQQEALAYLDYLREKAKTKLLKGAAAVSADDAAK